ncbi:DUF1353 domain-containing protein [Pseudooceanicola sp. C21-150M6]|uniref:DUF1353 domain-containing protein n=1 Tax=Pseudooceanicola sp. C21-150M6 TaxID=3434355 RepID=UPI003D7FF03C
MRGIFLSLPVLTALSACAGPTTHGTYSAPAAGFCSGSDTTLCTFVNAPLQLAAQIVRLPRRAYPFRPLASDLSFVDAGGRRWVAPKGILTDGASIPPAFADMIGAPTTRQFAGAAAIHDSYCGVGNEGSTYYHTRPWRDTHRMFYEALRVGGTAERKAKTMFAAVYLGGPRWPFVRPDPLAEGEVLSSQGQVDPLERDDLTGIPLAELRALLASVQAEISASNPTIPQIERFLDRGLSDLRRAYLRPEPPGEGEPEGQAQAEPEPSVEEPSVEEPSVEEPSVEEPAVEEPAVEEPAVVDPEAPVAE